MWWTTLVQRSCNVRATLAQRSHSFALMCLGLRTLHLTMLALHSLRKFFFASGCDSATLDF